MILWLWVLIGILAVIIAVLCIKIYLLRKAAREIRTQLFDKLATETNTLIDISSGDKHMKKLANDINGQLRILRNERHRFCQGDTELREAITNISHDIRTPLTAICGYLDLLEREEKSDNCNRYLEIIRSRTEILKQLTEELFRYSVFSSASDELELEEISLNGALEESISAYYTALTDAKIEPIISIAEKKIIRKLNKNALSRIFGNIISNAIKYSDGDLIITLTEDGKIEFSNTSEKLNGVQVGKLFDRFYTVESARKSTGLGLSIAKILTEKMNGTVTADYKDGMITVTVLFNR